MHGEHEIFFGTVKIDIKNRRGDELGIISLRFNPKTQQADVAITSGSMSNSAMLPFGEFFVTFEELEYIENAIGKLGG